MTKDSQNSKKEKVVKEKVPKEKVPKAPKVADDVQSGEKVPEKVVAEPKKKVVKEKKVSNKKDGPKKNLTSYMWFCNDERKNIKNENKELSSKAVISELAVRWNKIKESDPEKLKLYEKMAQDDKERYIKEKESFVSKIDTIVEEEVVVTPVEVVKEETPVSEVAVKKVKNKKK